MPWNPFLPSAVSLVRPHGFLREHRTGPFEGCYRIPSVTPCVTPHAQRPEFGSNGTRAREKMHFSYINFIFWILWPAWAVQRIRFLRTARACFYRSKLCVGEERIFVFVKFVCAQDACNGTRTEKLADFRRKMRPTI